MDTGFQNDSFFAPNDHAVTYEEIQRVQEQQAIEQATEQAMEHGQGEFGLPSDVMDRLREVEAESADLSPTALRMRELQERDSHGIIDDVIDKIQEIAEDYIAKIDALGGAAKAIEQGFIQREIAESAYNYQKSIESGDQVVVGVNKFTIEEPPKEGLLKIDSSAEVHQKEKLRRVRETRDNAKVQETLAALNKAAQTDENLMPYILDCARAYATEGEICGELRKVFGEYRPVEVL